MKSITRHVGKLEIIRRERNTPNGNPRWTVRIDGFTAITKSDASYSYSLTNHNGKTVCAFIGTHYGVATVDQIAAIGCKAD